MAHTHEPDCIDTDIIDLGDDGDGYIAYTVYECKITGEQYKNVSDMLGEDYDRDV